MALLVLDRYHNDSFGFTVKLKLMQDALEFTLWVEDKSKPREGGGLKPYTILAPILKDRPRQPDKIKDDEFLEFYGKYFQ